MRCCESPTTSTAAERARALAAALLFREILRPLAAAAGPLGELAVGAALDAGWVRSGREPGA